MTFNVKIPTPNGEEKIQVEAGSSVVFVGANGSGKTRLATYIEGKLYFGAHRIAAHRALTLNPKVPKINENEALDSLRKGNSQLKTRDTTAELRQRNLARWGGKASTHLLNDIDFVVQALFAEQSNKSLNSHKEARKGNTSRPEPTKFEILTEIWERLLPHRKLDISGDDISVSITGEETNYSASEMSDGERSVFYMLGQVLVIPRNSLLIFDEPELHVHRSIISKLWDELEAIRPDCAFVLISHDLEFAASRVADKYVILEYTETPSWVLEKVPVDSGFSEELTALILGSRKPILFIEGTASSLDLAIYRSCYGEWMIIPKGSCQEVIHSVVTMRNNVNLTRVTCSGIVDADDYDQGDKDYLSDLGIEVLPVSEIENMILLPHISELILKNEGHSESEIGEILEKLASEIFESLNSQGAIERAVTNYCKRRIDRMLKKIDLSESETVNDLTVEYRKAAESLDIENIAQQVRAKINEAITNRDLPLLLANYDNKGMLASAASHLKSCRCESFKNWIVRVLNNKNVPGLIEALKVKLPDIVPE